MACRCWLARLNALTQMANRLIVRLHTEDFESMVRARSNALLLTLLLALLLVLLLVLLLAFLLALLLVLLLVLRYCWNYC